MMEVENIINNLNKIIETAIINGGDAGGAYFSAPDDLAKAAYDMLYSLNLTTKYKVIDDEYGWTKIVPIEYKIKGDEYERKYLFDF